MADWKTAGTVLAIQAGTATLQVGFDYVDTWMNKTTEKVYKRPSTLLTLGLGGAFTVAGAMMNGRRAGPLPTVLLVSGTRMVSEGVWFLKEGLSASARTGRVALRRVGPSAARAGVASPVATAPAQMEVLV